MPGSPGLLLWWCLHHCLQLVQGKCGPAKKGNGDRRPTKLLADNWEVSHHPFLIKLVRVAPEPDLVKCNKSWVASKHQLEISQRLLVFISWVVFAFSVATSKMAKSPCLLPKSRSCHSLSRPESHQFTTILLYCFPIPMMANSNIVSTMLCFT